MVIFITVPRLWFDVGIKRYTTVRHHYGEAVQLWFDVGIKRYTTCAATNLPLPCCGLM